MTTSAEEAYSNGRDEGLTEQKATGLPRISTASGEQISPKELDRMIVSDYARRFGLDAVLKTLGGEEAARVRLGSEEYDAIVQELAEKEKK